MNMALQTTHQFQHKFNVRNIGASVQRSSGWRSAFGRSTAGNDVVATIFIRFLLGFFFPFFFLRRDLFS